MDFLPNVIALKALFPSDLEVRTFAPLQRSPEALPLIDLIVVNSFVRLLRARLLVEFGTARGRTAVNMALNAPADAEVISLDIQRHLPQYVHGGARITRIVAASRSFDETPYAGLVDFIFIDGAHEYEDVLSDSRKAMAMVRPGGVVLWHDYHPTQPGVTRALHELYKSDGRCEGLTRILLEEAALSSMVYYNAPAPVDTLTSILVPLLSKVIGLCRRDRVARVFLFGAGRHTDVLLPLWVQQGGPPVQGILTSEPPGVHAPSGLPLISVSTYTPGEGDAIVLSSQTFETEMAAVCRRLWPRASWYPLYDSPSSNIRLFSRDNPGHSVNRARSDWPKNVAQDEAVPHPEFRVYSLVELFPDDTLVEVFSPFARLPEESTYFDVAILNSLATLVKPRLIVEFGTATGRTALNLAINAPDASVVTIDLENHRKQYVLEPFSERVTKIIISSTEFDVEPWLHQADLVFIDGSHDYEVVLSDSMKAIELVRPGGVLIWHDYHVSQPGVTRALHELYATDVRFQNLGVICPDTTFALLFAS